MGKKAGDRIDLALIICDVELLFDRTDPRQQLFLTGMGAFLTQLTELLGDRHLGRILTLIIYTFVPLDDCVRGTQLRQ